MKPFTEILQSSRFVEGRGQRYTLDETWMQGRAIYGGLSTALCLDGVLKQFPDLPPLRSVNVNFIGLGNEEVYVTCSVLRQGKSVAFIQAELIGEKGLINQTVFTFGANRDSKLDEVYVESKEVIRPESARAIFPEQTPAPGEPGGPPAFTQHFETRFVSGSRPFSGADEPSFELWVKHKDASANDLVALVALADMPPPGVLPLFKEFAPISSMTWMFNILREDLSNQSGWWLFTVQAEHARQGYSSQNMSIHNDQGDLVLVGRQNIAVFY